MNVIRCSGSCYGRISDLWQKKWQKSVLLGKKLLPPVGQQLLVRITSSQECFADTYHSKQIRSTLLDVYAPLRLTILCTDDTA